MIYVIILALKTLYLNLIAFLQYLSNFQQNKK